MSKVKKEVITKLDSFFERLEGALLAYGKKYL
jgi:hypothetical protein